MADLYEIVLQQVAEGELLGLFERVQADAGSVSSLVASEALDVRLSRIDRALLDAFISFSGDVCLSVSLNDFRVSESLCVPMVFFRIIKYGGLIDVELSFESVDGFTVGRVMALMQLYVVALSREFYIKDFYGGLEPAEDTDTRFFTGHISGPME